MSPLAGRMGRAAAAVLVLAVGVLCAGAGVLLHGHAWGLALGWLTGAAATWALPGTWWGRPVFALGWLLVLVVVIFPRPEGDFLIADNLSGYALLASGPVFVAVALLSSRPGRRGGRRPPRAPHRAL